MTDYSFIRLRDNFDDAKNLNESPLANHSYYEQVHLLPSESYLQISNTPNGISFQSDYTANIVNCNNDVLLDVTEHIFISEFTSHTGLNQISFEIVNIPKDFGYDVLFLRIESNTNSSYVFWSSPFVCTEDSKEETNRYEYWSDTTYKGIDYTVSQKKQSIRLNTVYNQALDQNQIDSYYRTTTGVTVAPRALLNEVDEYFIKEFNSYYLRRLDVLLTHDYVYIDGVRSEYSNPIDYTERIERSNIINTRFTVSKDNSDIFELGYQIYEGIQVLSFTPTSSYTVGNVPENAIVSFNQNVNLESGSVNLYADNGDLLKSWNENELTQVDNTITTSENLNSFANTQRSYYFQIDSGLVSSNSGELFLGINNTTSWTFIIQSGEYDEDEYNNDEYVTDDPTPTSSEIFNNTFNEIFG